MSATSCYVFAAEPGGLNYMQLIDACCALGTKMSVVVRDPKATQGLPIERTLRRLSEFRSGDALVREWPGTILLADYARIYWHTVGPGLAECLQELASNLFEWVHPEFPEDVCFYRADDSPILVTISHEKEAYLLLKDADLRVLRARTPQLASCIKYEGGDV